MTDQNDSGVYLLGWYHPQQNQRRISFVHLLQEHAELGLKKAFTLLNRSLLDSEVPLFVPMRADAAVRFVDQTTRLGCVVRLRDPTEPDQAGRLRRQLSEALESAKSMTEAWSSVCRIP